MTGRIERKNVAAPAPRTTPAQTAEQKAAKVAAQVASLFVDAALSSSEKLSPTGERLAVSASPSSLWENDGGLVAELVRMSPGRRAEHVEAVEVERSELNEQIGDRVDHLETKWKRVGARKKEQALRDFVNMAEVAPKDKAKIEALVDKSSNLEGQIQDLAAQLKATYPARTPEENIARRLLKLELVELRQEQRATVNEAKVIIDASGQSAALLAVGEASIDPNAKTSGESLLSMMGRWLHLTSVVNFFTEFFMKAQQQEADVRKKAEIIDEHVRTIAKSGFSRTDLAMISSGIKTSAV